MHEFFRRVWILLARRPTPKPVLRNDRDLRRDPDDIVRAVEETKSPSALLAAASLVLTTKREIAGQAVRALVRWLEGATPTELLGLDGAVREMSRYCGMPDRWHQMQPRDIVTWEEFGRAALPLLGLASFHPNGHIREAALRRLATNLDGDELGFLVIRLNDWVAPIRQIALAALQDRLVPSYAHHLLRYLQLIYRLERCRRYDHADLVGSVTGLLRDPSCRITLREGCDSPDRSVRRSCYRLFAESTSSDSIEIVERALRDKDPSIRLDTARQIARCFDGEPLGRLLETMRLDRFHAVRREAYGAYVAKCPEIARTEMLHALLDPSASVREIARYYLNRMGSMDYLAFYRDTLPAAGNDVICGAMLGLGEVGKPDDAPLITRYLISENTAVRRSAIRSIAKLDGQRYLDSLVQALSDDRPSVSREASRALVFLRWAQRREWIVRLFRGGAHLHARRNALVLLAGSGKWTGLPYVIEASADPDRRMASIGNIRLRTWISDYNKAFTAPTVEELGLIALAIEKYSPAIPPEVLNDVRQLYHYWDRGRDLGTGRAME